MIQRLQAMLVHEVEGRAPLPPTTTIGAPGGIICLHLRRPIGPIRGTASLVTNVTKLTKCRIFIPILLLNAAIRDVRKQPSYDSAHSVSAAVFRVHIMHTQESMCFSMASSGRKNVVKPASHVCEPLITAAQLQVEQHPQMLRATLSLQCDAIIKPMVNKWQLLAVDIITQRTLFSTTRKR